MVAFVSIYWFGGFLGSVSAPFTRSVLSIESYFSHSSAILPLYMRERSELVKRIQEQEEIVSSHSGDTASIARLMAENSELRSLLGTSQEPRILAGIIARPPHVPYDVLYIDRGTADGIVEGSVVYHSAFNAIGVVQNVFEHSAIVTLFSAPGTETAVYVYGSNIYSTAHGEGSGVVRIPVPQGIPTHEGDVVIIPGIEQGTLGTISHIESQATEPEQNGYVTYTTSIQSLNYVTVGRAVPLPISFEQAQKSVDTTRTVLFGFEIPKEYVHTAGTNTWSGTESGSTSSSSPL